MVHLPPTWTGTVEHAETIRGVGKIEGPCCPIAFTTTYKTRQGMELVYRVERVYLLMPKPTSAYTPLLLAVLMASLWLLSALQKLSTVLVVMPASEESPVRRCDRLQLRALE